MEFYTARMSKADVKAYRWENRCYVLLYMTMRVVLNGIT